VNAAQLEGGSLLQGSEWWLCDPDALWRSGSQNHGEEAHNRAPSVGCSRVVLLFDCSGISNVAATVSPDAYIGLLGMTIEAFQHTKP